VPPHLFLLALLPLLLLLPFLSPGLCPLVSGSRLLSSSTPPRKRGAPRGNTNALKHGFYARRLKKQDLAGLENCPSDGLQDEIAMLRVFIRRVIELGRDTDNLSEAVDLLRVLCLASTSLNRLIKTQHLLAPAEDEFTAAINQALEELMVELNIGSPDPPPSKPGPAPDPGEDPPFSLLP
jgi:hypothetical protein